MAGFKRQPRAILDFTQVLDNAHDDLWRTANYVDRWTNVEAEGAGILASLLGTHQEFADSLSKWLHHLNGIAYTGSHTLGTVNGWYNVNDEESAQRLDALLPPAPPYPPDSDSSAGQRR